MTQNVPLRQGDFQWQPLVGAFRPEIANFANGRTLFGMPQEALHAFGTVIDVEGNEHSFVRRLGYRIPPLKSVGVTTRRPPSMGPKLAILHVSEAEGGLAYDPRSRRSARGEAISLSLDNAGALFSTPAGAPYFKCYWQPDSIQYEEADLLSVRGKLLQPGMQWALLGRDLGMAYASHLYEIEGVFDGKGCKGFMFFDQVFMPEGAVLYAEKDIVAGEKLELCWYMGANRYADGSLEFGHFLVGNDRCGIAILSNGRRLIVESTTATAVVTRNANGSHFDRIDIDVDGQAWEIVARRLGTMPGFGAAVNPQQLAEVRRVGDKRQPLTSWWWGETAPSHGDRRTLRLQSAWLPEC